MKELKVWEYLKRIREAGLEKQAIDAAKKQLPEERQVSKKQDNLLITLANLIEQGSEEYSKAKAIYHLLQSECGMEKYEIFRRLCAKLC